MIEAQKSKIAKLKVELGSKKSKAYSQEKAVTGHRTNEDAEVD